MSNNNVLHLNDDSNLLSTIQTASTVPVMVAFKATWCGPCKTLAPILEQLAAEKSGAVTVVFVDVDEAQESALKYEIRAVPTTIVFKGGKETSRIVGLVSKAKLLQSL